jgi:hypothetical protein
MSHNNKPDRRNRDSLIRWARVRPVVIALRGLDHDLAVPYRHIEPGEELEAAPTTAPAWGRVPMPLPRRAVKDRVFGWVVASRRPLVASALCLAVIGVMAVNAMGAMPTSALASPMPPGSETDHGVQPIGLTLPLVSKPDRPAWSVSVEARLDLGWPGVNGVPGVAGASPVVPGAPGVAGVSPGVPAAGATAVLPGVAASSPPGAGTATPSTVYTPPATGPVATPSTPAVVPAVAAPVVDSRTSAQITADNASAAAALTSANAAQAAAATAAKASAAAAQTAATASAAAAKTAATALAAAEKVRLQALADAYAVAHPAG